MTSYFLRKKYYQGVVREKWKSSSQLLMGKETSKQVNSVRSQIGKVNFTPNTNRRIMFTYRLSQGEGAGPRTGSPVHDRWGTTGI